MFFGLIKKIIIILLVAALAAGIIFAFVRPSSGQLGGGTIPFGGKVIASRWCGCSHNFLLTFAPAYGIPTYQLTYSPFSPNGQQSNQSGTQAYKSFNLGPLTGMWVVGLYTPVAECSALEGECTTIPAPAGNITSTVGSSPIF